MALLDTWRTLTLTLTLTLSLNKARLSEKSGGGGGREIYGCLEAQYLTLTLNPDTKPKPN